MLGHAGRGAIIFGFEGDEAVLVANEMVGENRTRWSSIGLSVDGAE
jgi:hypothetical protein